MIRRLACQWLLALALAVPAAGCGNDPATPTSPSTPAEAVDAATRLFIGTLSPGGSAFYSFTVNQDSGVFLTLASVAPVGGRGVAPVKLDLGFGVPRGTGCALTTAVVVESDLAAQIREWRREGVHCVAVADPGTLSGDVTFAVRIGYSSETLARRGSRGRHAHRCGKRLQRQPHLADQRRGRAGDDTGERHLPVGSGAGRHRLEDVHRPDARHGAGDDHRDRAVGRVDRGAGDPQGRRQRVPARPRGHRRDGVSAQVSARVDGGTFCVQVLGPATAPGTVVFTVTLEHP